MSVCNALYTATHDVTTAVSESTQLESVLAGLQGCQVADWRRVLVEIQHTSVVSHSFRSKLKVRT